MGANQSSGEGERITEVANFDFRATESLDKNTPWVNTKYDSWKQEEAQRYSWKQGVEQWLNKPDSWVQERKM